MYPIPRRIMYMEVFGLTLCHLCKWRASVHKLNTRDLSRPSLEPTSSHIVFVAGSLSVSCCGELRQIKLGNR